MLFSAKKGGDLWCEASRPILFALICMYLPQESEKAAPGLGLPRCQTQRKNKVGRLIWKPDRCYNLRVVEVPARWRVRFCVGPLAQLVEQLTLNQRVAGSSPARLIFIMNKLRPVERLALSVLGKLKAYLKREIYLWRRIWEAIASTAARFVSSWTWLYKFKVKARSNAPGHPRPFSDSHQRPA
jgi:hypothetical protein